MNNKVRLLIMVFHSFIFLTSSVESNDSLRSVFTDRNTNEKTNTMDNNHTILLNQLQTAREFTENFTSAMPTLEKKLIHEESESCDVNKSRSAPRTVVDLLSANIEIHSQDAASSERKKYVKKDLRGVRPKTDVSYDSEYSVALLSFSNNSFRALCSGSLVTLSWVLTVASCAVKLDASKSTGDLIYAGNSKPEIESTPDKAHFTSKVLYIKNVFVHEKYESSTDKKTKITTHCNNIALVEAKGKFSPDLYLKPIRLMTAPWSKEVPPDVKLDMDASSSPKGLKDKRLLQTNSVMVERPCRCLKNKKSKKIWQIWMCNESSNPENLIENNLMGNGLVWDNKLRAIASFIITVKEVGSCVQVKESELATHIQVFQDICPYLKWINGHTKHLSKKEIPKIKKCKGSTLSTSKLPFLMCFIVLFHFILQSTQNC